MHGHRSTATSSVGHVSPILPQSAENPVAWTAIVRRRVGGRLHLTNEERNRLIAEVAYHRAERRGFLPGYEVEDWLAAEREISRILSRK